MTDDSDFVTWFVDEAGDPTLFGKGGKVVAATSWLTVFYCRKTGVPGCWRADG